MQTDYRCVSKRSNLNFRELPLETSQGQLSVQPPNSSTGNARGYEPPVPCLIPLFGKGVGHRQRGDEEIHAPGLVLSAVTMVALPAGSKRLQPRSSAPMIPACVPMERWGPHPSLRRLVRMPGLHPTFTGWRPRVPRVTGCSHALQAARTPQ